MEPNFVSAYRVFAIKIGYSVLIGDHMHVINSSLYM